MPQSRQLAAIMFTDIVGYTALMGDDEQKAIDLLEKNRQIHAPVIEQFGGKLIKELGDGMMASFTTVTDAVSAAVNIQQQCNVKCEFTLRIGIHLGEVVFENGDIFGDGVNIAARIQSLAPPGGIFISEAVHNNIVNKQNIDSSFVRTATLKNVKNPVRVYQVKAKDVSSVTTTAFSGHRRGWKMAAFVFTGLLLLLLAGNFVVKNLKAGTGASSMENPEDKSIAVLPFVNMSREADQEFFSDGLSEELLNLLAKIPALKVIGRTSSFSFKGKNEDLRDIARQLGVTYLLEGSVRKDGNRVRVTAQLIKATDGSRLWGDTYDKDLSGIFKIQDEIASAVVNQLKVKLLTVSQPVNIEVHNLILQGKYFQNKMDQEGLEKASVFYKAAIEIDSADALAWALLGSVYSRQAWQNFVHQDSGYEKARRAAIKSISLNESLAAGYITLGSVRLYHDFDWAAADEAYMKAKLLGPENADLLYAIGGGLYSATGRWEESIREMEKCIVLDPLRPISYLNLGNILTNAGQIEKGIGYFKKALELNPAFQRAHMYTGRNYILLGKPEKALSEMQQENNEEFRKFGLALAYFATGNKAEADSALQDFKTSYPQQWAYLLAELHAFRGETDLAFRYLETAYQKRDSWLVFIKGDPLLKNLFKDPRYIAFLVKMNLAGH